MARFSEVCRAYANRKLVNVLTKFDLPELTYFHYPNVSTKVFAYRLRLLLGRLCNVVVYMSFVGV